MNAFVLHTALVCLAIAGSVKCLFSVTEANSTEQHRSAETLADKCFLNSPKDYAYENLIEDVRNLYVCLDSHNLTEMIKNLYPVHTNKNYESLLKGLCTKMPDWHHCRRNYTTSLMECYNDTEKIFLTNLQNMSSVLESFTCQNDGERITAFFSDGGVNCVKNRSTTLEQCFKTLDNKSYFPKTLTHHKTFVLDSLMKYFKFNREQCNDLFELKSCLVDDLRHCEQPTVANMVNSGIELALRHSPCSEFMTTMA